MPRWGFHASANTMLFRSVAWARWSRMDSDGDAWAVTDESQFWAGHLAAESAIADSRMIRRVWFT